MGYLQERNRLYLVMDYCAGGDLAGYIRKAKRMPEATARQFMRQLADGLRELRFHHLVHVRELPWHLCYGALPSGCTLGQLSLSCFYHILSHLV